MFKNEKTKDIFKSDTFLSFSIPMQEIFLAILDCYFEYSKVWENWCLFIR